MIFLCQRQGRSDTYATEFDLEAEEYVPLPKGDVHKKKEVIQDVTLHDLDIANARPQVLTGISSNRLCDCYFPDYILTTDVMCSVNIDVNQCTFQQIAWCHFLKWFLTIKKQLEKLLNEKLKRMMPLPGFQICLLEWPLTLCDLDLRPRDQYSSFMPLPNEPLVSIGTEIGSFVFRISRLVTNEWRYGQWDMPRTQYIHLPVCPIIRKSCLHCGSRKQTPVAFSSNFNKPSLWYRELPFLTAFAVSHFLPAVCI